MRSEARHYQDYLVLAEQVAGEGVEARVQYLAGIEAELIQSLDDDFKFHSGKPVK
ncbi:tRNA-(ms[2]io[6]A)-hydroxylase [Vibrio astriarenae]|nr:tRNA-(ms[2]io[6]A)-hydroxylase [Vibrio sp. C7]